MKVIFLIFPLILAADSASANKQIGVPVTGVRLKSLVDCLTSTGIDSKKIHLRKSGNAYTELNWQWNTLNGRMEPLGYLVATETSDIQNAIICCKSTDIRIVAKSGGHSYVKNGFGDARSLIVDLGRLNKISVKPEEMRCEVGAGARIGQISFTLWETGKFLIPSGVCPSVGIAGLTMGGGWGHFTRLYGLTLDNVVEMEMVDADGKFIVINNTTNNDLFWALRGGGGGSFGIVTNFKFNMYRIPKSIAYGIYEYNFDDFVSFFDSWQNLITSGISNNVLCLLEMDKHLIQMKIFAINDQFEENTSESVNRLQSSFNFPIVTSNSTQVLSYSDFMLNVTQFYSPTLLTHFSQLASITKHRYVLWKKIKSIYVDKILTIDEISGLKKLLGSYLQHASLHVEHCGGAMNDVSITETSFIHRGSMYQIQLKPSSTQDEQPNKEADCAMKTFFEKSKAVLHHRESYQNYLDQDIPDYLNRYYGSNLERLTQIKRTIDPDNIFHHRQSIPLNLG